MKFIWSDFSRSHFSIYQEAETKVAYEGVEWISRIKTNRLRAWNWLECPRLRASCWASRRRRSTTYEINVVHIRHVLPRGASVPKRALIVSVPHRSNYCANIVFSSTLASWFIVYRSLNGRGRIKVSNNFLHYYNSYLVSRTYPILLYNISENICLLFFIFLGRGTLRHCEREITLIDI